MKLSQNGLNKKLLSNLISLTEKNKMIKLIFEIENWLWKSFFGDFFDLWSKSNQKNIYLAGSIFGQKSTFGWLCNHVRQKWRHTNLHLRHDILDQRPWPQAQQLVGAGEAGPQARSRWPHLVVAMEWKLFACVDVASKHG